MSLLTDKWELRYDLSGRRMRKVVRIILKTQQFPPTILILIGAALVRDIKGKQLVSELLMFSQQYTPCMESQFVLLWGETSAEFNYFVQPLMFTHKPTPEILKGYSLSYDQVFFLLPIYKQALSARLIGSGCVCACAVEIRVQKEKKG